MVQWLRLHTSKAGDAGSILGWGTKIPHVAWHSEKVKNSFKKYAVSWMHISLELS